MKRLFAATLLSLTLGCAPKHAPVASLLERNRLRDEIALKKQGYERLLRDKYFVSPEP